MPAKPHLTASAIRAALLVTSTRAALLREVGVCATRQNYVQLERVAEAHGIELPCKSNRGKPGPRPNTRTSALWDRGRLLAAVDGAHSMREVLERLDLRPNARPRLQQAAAMFGISLPRGMGGMDKTEARRTAIRRVLVKGTRRINGERLRRYMLTLGLWPYVCAECGQPPEWNGKPLVLQVDHVNGDPADNRPENLRFLCPNCHTQTETFAGRNCRPSMGNGVTGNTPGSGSGDGHVHPGSNPGSPAHPVAA
jgi:hypothetical protein